MSDDHEACQYCGDKAIFTDNVWGCYFWCEDCIVEATNDIYNDACEELEE